MADGRDTVSCLLLRPRWGVRSIVMSVSVCLCARLSVHVRASPFFVHVTYGRGSVSTAGVVIRYVFPVLWMTSYLHNHLHDALKTGCKGKGKRSVAVRNRSHRYVCHMGSHSVTCHPAEVTFPPLPQPKLVLE